MLFLRLKIAITATLSKKAKCVFAIDADPLRIKCAEINIQKYGNPRKVKLQAANAFEEIVWLESKPDVVVADPDWAKQGDMKSDHTSDIALTQPPVPELLDTAKRFGVAGVVLRLSPVSNMSVLRDWHPFEIEKVFVDGAEKYWFAYFGSVRKKKGHFTNLKLVSDNRLM